MTFPGLLAPRDDDVIAREDALDGDLDEVGQEPPRDDVSPRDQDGDPACGHVADVCVVDFSVDRA